MKTDGWYSRLGSWNKSIEMCTSKWCSKMNLDNIALNAANVKLKKKDRG